MLDNMRISGKLRIIVAMGLGMSLILSAAGLFGVNRIGGQGEKVYAESLAPALHLADINERMAADYRELLAAAAGRPAGQNADLIRANTEAITRIWNEYIASGHAAIAGPAMVEDYRRSRIRLVTEGLLPGDEMAKAGKVDALREHITRTVAPLYTEAKGKAEHLSALHRDHARRLVEDIGVSHRRLLWAIAAVNVIGLAISVLVARHVGRRITRPVGDIVQAVERLAQGNTDFEVKGTGRKDEIGSIATALEVWRGNQARRKELQAAIDVERAIRAERAKKIEELAELFDKSVRTTVCGVVAAADRLQETSESLAGVVEQTSQQSSAVATASDEASANVQAVAAAAEQLAASIQEIGRQVVDSSSIAAEASKEAHQTNDLVRGLAEAAAKIGAVVNLINTIASQTNLLALNATIEAARAGDAGKGFAVVANEVKNLANQTARATGEISTQISEVQAATGRAVSAIEGIAGIIDRINEISGSISSAVEEQGAATLEIARNVQRASTGTRDVSTHISGIADGASATRTAAEGMLHSARDLQDKADRLDHEVDEFLRKISSSAGDTLDQLKKGLAAHGAWKARLAKAVDEGTSEFDPRKLSTDNNCDFGKWLYSVPDDVKRGDDWTRVRELHARFHQSAGQVLTLALDGRKSEAVAAMESSGPYGGVAKDLSDALEAWLDKLQSSSGTTAEIIGAAGRF